jgi:hypothetical protein
MFEDKNTYISETGVLISANDYSFLSTNQQSKCKVYKMETNNKPDFEKMASDDLNIIDHDGFLGYTAGCEKIWYDYVIPERRKSEQYKIAFETAGSVYSNDIQERDAKIRSLESSLLDITRQSCAKISELEKEIAMRNEYYENKVEATQCIINSNYTDWQRINSENQALKSELDKAIVLFGDALSCHIPERSQVRKDILAFLKDKR